MLKIDGRPILALHTSVPLWRDLAVGIEGDDVRGLQEELTRLGHPVAPDGRYGTATHTQMRGLLADLGIAVKPWQSVPLGQIVWLPAPEVTTETCAVALGATVGTGDPLITLPPALVGVSVTALPSDLVAGARVLDFGDVQAPTDGEGRVSEPAVLRSIEGTPAYGTILAEEAPHSAQVDWLLADPIQASAVPPRSIYGASDGAGCVSASGASYSVRVISSSLGATLVTFDDHAPPPTSVDLDPAVGPCA